jgi:hypothetical protein
VFERENAEDSRQASASCEPTLSRKEFVAFVLKRAGVVGTIIAAPKVVDKYLVRPAEAKAATSTRVHTEA